MAEYFLESRNDDTNDNVDYCEKKNLKPHAQAHLLSSTESCKICGERAARHVHYGATTCFSCRAFFRRSLQNHTAAKYVCRRNNMCDINNKTRKNCQYCRYMKCLAVGMNPNYVLSEEERKKRFRKKNNSGPSPDIVEDKSKVLQSSENNISSDLSKLEFEASSKLSSCGIGNVFSPTDPTEGNMKSEIPDHHQVIQDFSPPLPVHPQVSVISSNLSSCLQHQRNSIIMKLESPNRFGNTLNSMKTEILSPNIAGVSKNNSWDSKNGNFSNEQSSCSGMSSSGDLSHEKMEIFDQNYNAFDDIETSGFGSTDTDLEELKRRLVLEEDDKFFLTDEDKDEIAKVVNDHDNIYFSVNFGEVLIKEMLMCSIFGVQVSTSAALQAYKLQVERITRIANSTTDFTDLVKVDQCALLKENADLVVSLRGALFFDKKMKGTDQIMSSMGFEDRKLIKNLFSSMMKSNEMNHIEYKTLNSIQDPASKQTEDHYTMLQGKVAYAINDHVTSILMTYIILFSSDFVQLENKKMVERIQSNYLRLLEKHIASNEPKHLFQSKFANILNSLTLMREMADIKKARLLNHTACSQYNSSDEGNK